MTNELQQQTTTDSQQTILSFGSRLKAAREVMGLQRSDVAAQLRLNEKIVIMMEKDRYPSDLPATFIRGYLRAYSKLLQIPEYEVNQAIEPLQPKPILQDANLVIKKSEPMVTSSNYFMQLFTLLIVLTLAGLAGMWWYTRTNTTETVAVEVPTLNTTVESANTSMEQQPPIVVAPTPTPTAPTAAPENKAPTIETSPAVAPTTPSIETKATTKPDAAAEAQDADADESEAAPAPKREAATADNADEPEPDSADVDQTD